MCRFVAAVSPNAGLAGSLPYNHGPEVIYETHRKGVAAVAGAQLIPVAGLAFRASGPARDRPGCNR